MNQLFHRTLLGYISTHFSNDTALKIPVLTVVARTNHCTICDNRITISGAIDVSVWGTKFFDNVSSKNVGKFDFVKSLEFEGYWTFDQRI
jgi:hypothetical protein